MPSTATASVWLTVLLLLAVPPGVAAGATAGQSPVLPTASPQPATSPQSAKSSTTSPQPATSATTSPGSPPSASASPPPDPDEDVLGWENGYWHNESVDVDAADGLNNSEFEAVRDRAMARVELIRRIEFESTPIIEFRTREWYRERRQPPFDPQPRQDQFWEAAFVVGENTSTAAARDHLFDVVVDGFAGDPVVLIVENTSAPRLDPLVLAHELTHVLRFQEGLSEEFDDRPELRDWSTAAGAALEGEASWVERRYESRCGVEWSCIERPPGGSQAVPDETVNMGLYLDFATRYTLGRDLVRRHHERDGIAAVDRLVESLPSSTEQVIHPAKYGNDTPTAVAVADRTGDDWHRIEADETEFTRRYNFGEAGLYVMLWANGLVETGPVNVTVDQQTGVDYTHPATAGWDGDVVVPYTNGSHHGYVFKSVWDTEADAREFEAAYLTLLDRRGARRVGEGVYRIAEGPYADAFRVVRRNATLVVVNAPTVDALRQVHRPAGATPTPTSTATPTPTPTPPPNTGSPSTTAPGDDTAGDAGPDGSATTTRSPGLGVVATALALVAFVAGAVVTARRR